MSLSTFAIWQLVGSTRFSLWLMRVRKMSSSAVFMIHSIFATDCDNEDELDHILGGADSDELEAMSSSPQQLDCSQELLGIVPAPTEDAVSTAGLAPC